MFRGVPRRVNGSLGFPQGGGAFGGVPADVNFVGFALNRCLALFCALRVLA